MFDEATSSLDQVSENKIIDSIFELGENVTVISIAHRKATILAADRVLVIDQGRIVDS